MTETESVVQMDESSVPLKNERDRSRISAHLSDAFTLLILAVCSAGSWYVFQRSGNVFAEYALWTFVVLGAVFALATVGGVLLRGQTLGMKRHRVQWVSAYTGRPQPFRNVLKGSLELVTAVPTAGMGTVFICLLSLDAQGRTIFDRVCGTQTVYLAAEDEQEVFVEEEPVVPLLSDESEEDRKEYVLSVDFSSRLKSEADGGQIGEAQAPSADRLGESQWAFSRSPSSLDLAELGHTVKHQGTYRDSALPLTDARELTDLERSVGIRPSGSVRLVFDDGTRYDLVGTLLLGRDPVAEGHFKGAATLAVTDSARSVSKTHAVLFVREGKVFVEDLDSTNGTRLSTADGATKKLTAGEPVSAPPGTLIIFGKRRVLVNG